MAYTRQTELLKPHAKCVKCEASVLLDSVASHMRMNHQMEFKDGQDYLRRMTALGWAETELLELKK